MSHLHVSQRAILSESPEVVSLTGSFSNFKAQLKRPLLWQPCQNLGQAAPPPGQTLCLQDVRQSFSMGTSGARGWGLTPEYYQGLDELAAAKRPEDVL